MTVLELRHTVRRGVVPIWHHIWLPAALGVALAINVAWVGVLGYGIVRLLLA